MIKSPENKTPVVNRKGAPKRSRPLPGRRNSYDPYSATERDFVRYLDYEGPTVFECRPPPVGYFHPASLGEVRAVFGNLSPRYVEGIRLVCLAGLSRRQKSRRYLKFGAYVDGCIFLYPLPENLVIYQCPEGLRPDPVHDLRRFGAQWTDDGRRLKLEREGARRYYLESVLLHEIGHHNDHRTKSLSEPFADHFARMTTKTTKA